MPKIVITDVPDLDGEYELELVFTHRDFRTIKQVAGVRANEIMDAIEAGDLDVVVALAHIALQRASKRHVIDQLWDAEAGKITLDVTDVEDDASPPSLTPLEPVEEPKSSDVSTSSGNGTSDSTEPSPETLTLVSSGIQPPVST